MSETLRITVLGATGYTGAAIVEEAAARGHVVTAIARHAPEAPVDGVEVVEADATDDTVLDRAVDADVVVATLSPRGALAGALFPLYAHLAKRAAAARTRLIVIGGFSGLRREPGSPRNVEVAVDPRFLAEAQEMVRVLEWLPTSDPQLDWVFVSPAERYTAALPGRVTGTYRLGGDVVLPTVDGGPTELSAPDLAKAVLDLAESDHHREHVSVAH